MPSYSESFEGTDGSAITTANSVFTTISGAGSGVRSASAKLFGSLGALISGSASAFIGFVDMGSPQVNLYTRAYMKLVTPPTAGAQGNVLWATLGTTARACVAWRTDGGFNLRSPTTIQASTTGVWLDQWVRLEHSIVGSTQTLNVFAGANLHGATPSETISGPVTVATGSDQTRLGFSTVDTFAFMVDEWASSTTAMPARLTGPVVTNPNAYDSLLWNGSSLAPLDTFLWDGTALIPLDPEPATTTPVVPAARFPGDPGVGRILWGATRDGGVPAVPARATQFAQAQGLSGRLWPQAFHRFMTPAQATVQGANEAIADALIIDSWDGCLPLIDVKEPGGASFAQVGTGIMDQMLDTLFEGLAAQNKPRIVSFHNEPAGDGKGGAAEYGAAIQRIKQRRDAAGASLISITGALGMGQYTGFGGGNGSPVPWIEAIAPHTDVWNTHRYLQATDASAPNRWFQPDEIYGEFWDLLDAVDPNRAKIQGEWAVHTRSSDLTFAVDWLGEFRRYFRSRGGAAAFYFDSDQNLNQPAQLGWALDINGETSRLVEFARLLRLPTNG